MTKQNDELAWYVIHTNQRQEKRTENNLRAWNVETFAPEVKTWRRNQFTGERICCIKPLFSRYIFARFNLERLFHKVRYTRGIHSLVSFGEGPVEVDDEIISVIRSRMAPDGFVRICNDLKPSDVVVIEDGPLKDFTGIFEREMKDYDRVLVLLNMIKYQARVQVDRDFLCKVINPCSLA